MMPLRHCLTLSAVALCSALSGCVGAPPDAPESATAAASEGADDTAASPEATTCWNPFVTPSGVVEARVGDEVLFVAGTNTYQCYGGVTSSVLVTGVSAGGSARVESVPGFPNLNQVFVRVLPTGPQTIYVNMCVNARLNVWPHTSWGYQCYQRQIHLAVPRPAATVSASPSTLTLAPGAVGTTSVTWSSTSVVDVRVSRDGAPSTLFASGASGTQRAPWIEGGHTFLFTVHPRGLTDQPLASVTVRGILATNTLSASPSVVSVPSGGLGQTTLSWNSTGYGYVDVRVSHNGAPSTLFASGASGSQGAPWIQAGHSYRFTLHAPGSTTGELAAALVQGVAQ